jgi:hypothetical protein
MEPSLSSLEYYKCRACNKRFYNLGDMQRHIVVEHHQKGDIPER